MVVLNRDIVDVKLFISVALVGKAIFLWSEFDDGIVEIQEVDVLDYFLLLLKLGNLAAFECIDVD